ncbi:MAG: T9SS type A sorting domain-containing protein [Bacteroidetes bacterium]|nr:T9SS type A sorting domain-containing protein [Bacteroidota bacterium]
MKTLSSSYPSKIHFFNNLPAKTFGIKGCSSIAIILFLLFISTFSHAQEPVYKQWFSNQKSSLSTAADGADWFYNITKTSDGGYIGCGFTQATSTSPKQCSLAKIDAHGNLVWEQYYNLGDASKEGNFQEVIEADNAYIAIGEKRDALNNRVIFLAKVDKSNGNLIEKILLGTAGNSTSNYDYIDINHHARGRSIQAVYTNAGAYDGVIIGGNTSLTTGTDKLLLVRLTATYSTLVAFGTNGVKTYDGGPVDSKVHEKLWKVRLTYNATPVHTGFIIVGLYTINVSTLDHDVVVINTNKFGLPNWTNRFWDDELGTLKALNGLSKSYTDDPGDITYCTNCTGSPNENNDERGFDIQQITNGGDFVISAAFDYYACSSSPYCVDEPFKSALEYHEFDGVLIKILGSNGELEWAENIEHFEGIAENLPIRVDGNGDFIQVSTKVDVIGTDNILKTYISKWSDQGSSGSKEWDRLFLAESTQTENCIFGLDIATDGGFILGGNNDKDGENYLAIKLHSDCQPSQTYDINNGITISTSITWDPFTFATTTIKVKGQIVVASDVTFTIKDVTVEFADTRQTQDYPNYSVAPTNIKVSRGIDMTSIGGGNLILDNCTLTGISACNGMWDGVQVLGLQTITSGMLGKQGNIIMKNNARVEHAHIGVLLGAFNYDSEGYPTVSKNIGGTLQADDAYFFQNRKQVYFAFGNPAHGSDPDSYLTGCTFECTGALRDQIKYDNIQGTTEFVTLRARRDDITFKECIFKNTGNFAALYKGTGIYSTNSEYSLVKGAFTGFDINDSVFVTNDFTDLHIGIDAYSTGGLNPTLLEWSDFNGLDFGIVASGSTFDDITKNKISNIQPGGIGMYFYDTQGFKVLDNGISSDPNLRRRGIISRNSTSIGGEITDNNINGPIVSVQTEKNNDGLQIICNVFDQFTYGIAVSGGTLADHGNDCLVFSTDRPKNAFKVTCSQSITHIYSSNVQFDYYQNDDDPFPADPTCVSSSVNFTRCFLGFSEVCALSAGPFTKAQLYQKIDQETDPIKKQLLINDLMRLLLATDEREEAKSVLDTLVSTVEAKKILVPAYLDDKEYSKCWAKLGEIPSVTYEDQQYHKLWDTLVAFCELGNELYEIDSATEQIVREVASTQTMISAHAESVLSLAFEETFIRTPETLPIDTSSKKGNEPEESIINNYYDFTFRVYPNPTSESFTFEFYSSEKFLQGRFMLYDLLGEIIEEFKFNYESDHIRINTENLNNGIYFYKLFADGIARGEGKVSIIK